MEKAPALVFSPGAWHMGACFQPTTDVLSSQGYRCISLDLPTIGSELKHKQPQQSWDEDVEHIRNAMLKELDDQDVNVVLILHSYSGTVGSEACEGLDEKGRKGAGKSTWVQSLVYLSAIVMDIDGWIWEQTGGKPVDPDRTIIKGDLSYVQDMASWFYNECKPQDQKLLSSRLQSHAWKAFFSKVTYTAWRDIPSFYLYATNDHAIPYEMQKLFTSYEGGQWTTMTCDADHSPMVSRVQDAVKIIKMAAGDKV